MARKFRPSDPRTPWLRPPEPYAPRRWNTPGAMRSVPFLVVLTELLRFGPAYTRAVAAGPATYDPVFIGMQKYQDRRRADVVPLLDANAASRVFRHGLREQAFHRMGGPSALYRPPVPPMPMPRDRVTPASALNVNNVPAGAFAPLSPTQQRMRDANYLTDVLRRGRSATDEAMAELTAQFEQG